MNAYELFPFGPEGGPSNRDYTHLRAAPERRSPAVGPAGAGDVRAQRGAGALAVLAQDAAAGGPDGVVSATAAAGAPGVVGGVGGGGGGEFSAGAPAREAGAVGVHFSGTTAVPGIGGSTTARAPAGFPTTSGPMPAAEGSRSLTGSGGVPTPSNPFSGTAPAKAI